LLRAETEVALAFPRDAAYYRETCERVLHNSVQMSRLIDQLLSLARADAGVEVLRFEPVNLPDVLDEVANEWIGRFAEAKIQFTCNLAPHELWVEADYIALKRLLNILLENAWRYTPSEKSVTLTCSEQVQSSDRITAEISVADTGIGISPENQLRIFQRFCRIAQPLNGDFTGNGLGLVLAQWIAERHGSAITLQSSYGQGSRFSLSLNILPTDQKRTEHSSIQLTFDVNESTHSS
jgi:signal transduction histidine kinase